MLSKAKTKLSEQTNSSNNSQVNNVNPSVSAKFLKQYFNSNQNDGYFRSYTEDFKKHRDDTIGNNVIQTNKLLITLDKLISFDHNVVNDDAKRESTF